MENENNTNGAINMESLRQLGFDKEVFLRSEGFDKVGDYYGQHWKYEINEDSFTVKIYIFENVINLNLVKYSRTREMKHFQYKENNFERQYKEMLNCANKWLKKG